MIGRRPSPQVFPEPLARRTRLELVTLGHGIRELIPLLEFSTCIATQDQRSRCVAGNPEKSRHSMQSLKGDHRHWKELDLHSSSSRFVSQDH